MVGLARLHEREGAKPSRQTIVLEVLAARIVVEIVGVGAVVHVVDGNGLVRPGHKGDVLPVPNARVTGDPRSTDEEAEHIIVLGSYPFVVLLGPEYKIETKAIAHRDHVELELACI